MWYKSRFFISNVNAFYKDANVKCPYDADVYAGVQMQSLFMMVSAHIFKPWCKCLLVSVPWCKCPLVGMPWCECFDANNLFKNSLCFQNQSFLGVWNKNIFESRFVIFRKVIFFFFYLRLPKKLVITVRNLWIGHWLKIWWSGSRDLFSQFGQRDGTCSRPFSRNKISLKIKHLKTIHFSSPWIWQFDRRQDQPW